MPSLQMNSVEYFHKQPPQITFAHLQYCLVKPLDRFIIAIGLHQAAVSHNGPGYEVQLQRRAMSHANKLSFP